MENEAIQDWIAKVEQETIDQVREVRNDYIYNAYNVLYAACPIRTGDLASSIEVIDEDTSIYIQMLYYWRWQEALVEAVEEVRRD